MESLERLPRRYNLLSEISAAFLYTIAVAVALNFFWQPGHMYLSGITGFAQLINTLSKRYLPFTLIASTLYFALNVPLFILGWFKIGKKFTTFTIIAVFFVSIMIHSLPTPEWKLDPLIYAVSGGAISGIDIELTLKSGISTGGLDTVGIILRKKMGQSFGSINIAINLLIVIAVGFVFGWTRSLYTALNIFINDRVIDTIHTQHQKMQVMIVTEHPKKIIGDIQEEMHRGITIIHDVEGAYGHTEKTILLTVIDRYDMHDIHNIIVACDPYAFVSVNEVAKVYGRFKEQELV